jgi:hypothetical protein
MYTLSIIWYQMLLNLNHYNYHIILMNFHEISDDTQIVCTLKHNQYIILRICMFVKIFFFSFLRFFVNLHEVVGHRSNHSFISQLKNNVERRMIKSIEPINYFKWNAFELITLLLTNMKPVLVISNSPWMNG